MLNTPSNPVATSLPSSKITQHSHGKLQSFCFPCAARHTYCSPYVAQKLRGATLPDWLVHLIYPKLVPMEISSLYIAAAITAPSHICIISLCLPHLVAPPRAKDTLSHIRFLLTDFISPTHYTRCDRIWSLTVAPTLSTARNNHV